LVRTHPDALGPWYDAEDWERWRAEDQQREVAEANSWLTHVCRGCGNDQECLQPGYYHVTWGEEHIRYSDKCASGARCKALNTRWLCKDCAKKRNKKGGDPIPETFTMPDDDRAFQDHSFKGSGSTCVVCGYERRWHYHYGYPF
jgi:hypothetical protein